MGSAFHQLCPRHSGTLTPTAPTAFRLWDTFTFYYHNKNDRTHSVLAASKFKVLSRERLVKTQADLNESPFP